MPHLRITIDGKSQKLQLQKALSVAGRNTDLDIPLATTSASREHFRIGRLKDGSWAIEDLGSTNGTFVNGKQMKRGRIKHEDVIQIGRDCTIVFVDAPAAAPAPKKTAPGTAPVSAKQKRKGPSGPVVLKSKADREKERKDAERQQRKLERTAALKAGVPLEEVLKQQKQQQQDEDQAAKKKKKKKKAKEPEPAEQPAAPKTIHVIDSEETLIKLLAREGGIKAILAAGERVTFGKYDLLKKLSEGGMGVVFKAKHPKRGLVGLKLLRGRMVDEENIARFKGEAWAISAFDHPNIVKVSDLGEHSGMHYIAMEYIDGEDLLGIGIRRELTYYQISEVIMGLASVLELVHGKNIYHRDIKPQNAIMDKSGRVKLIDFGIATIERETAAAETAEGLIMGTPAFLSPEQGARGKMGDIDGRADLYSLGAVMYYLLTGQRPFTGRSALAVLNMNMKQPPKHPHEIDHLIPGGLIDICLRLLEKQPADRYQSARELMTAITGWRKTKAGRSAHERHKKIVMLREKKKKRFGS
ncbi:MAG: FHA domain-containing serine/threonine-protein kinase [Planctomycetota bacterium]